MQKSRIDICHQRNKPMLPRKYATNGLGTGPPLGCCTDSHTTIQDCKETDYLGHFLRHTFDKALICPGLIYVYMTRFSKTETKEFPEG